MSLIHYCYLSYIAYMTKLSTTIGKWLSVVYTAPYHCTFYLSNNSYTSSALFCYKIVATFRKSHSILLSFPKDRLYLMISFYNTCLGFPKDYKLYALPQTLLSCLQKFVNSTTFDWIFVRVLYLLLCISVVLFHLYTFLLLALLFIVTKLSLFHFFGSTSNCSLLIHHTNR